MYILHSQILLSKATYNWLTALVLYSTMLGHSRYEDKRVICNSLNTNNLSGEDWILHGTHSPFVFTFLNGLDASSQTLQGAVISATSGLLFHIRQLGGNQIRPEWASGWTHKPVWPTGLHAHRHRHTHTRAKWCSTHKQAAEHKPWWRARTHTDMSKCGFEKVNGAAGTGVRQEDVMCVWGTCSQSDQVTVLSRCSQGAGCHLVSASQPLSALPRRTRIRTRPGLLATSCNLQRFYCFTVCGNQSGSLAGESPSTGPRSSSRL